MSKTRKPCEKYGTRNYLQCPCAWAVSDLCLAYPYREEWKDEPFYRKEKGKTYRACHKLRKDVTLAECQAMYADRLDEGHDRLLKVREEKETTV